MKKKLWICFIGVVLCLTGCNKSNDMIEKELSNEEKLCNNAMPEIEKYNNKQLSYNQFLESIKSDYNNYCPDESNSICTRLESMYYSVEMDYELKDCSKYNANTEIGKSAKNLCIASNKVIEKIIAEKPAAEKAYIDLLKSSCSNVYE